MRLEDFLSGTAETKAFGVGENIFLKGDQAGAAYYVISGQVEIFQEVGGERSVMASLGPGEIFGEMALLRFDEYTLSANAASDVETYVISPAMLQEQVRETHPLIRAILDMLIDRMHTVNEVLIDLDTANRA